MMENVTLYDTFDDYHFDQLSDIERQDFEQKLQSDALFREDFEAYQLMIQGIEQFGTQQLTGNISTIENKLNHENFFIPQPKILNMKNTTPNSTRILAIAASVAVLVVAAIYFTQKNEPNYDNSNAFAQFHKPEQTVVTKIMDELSAPGFAGDKNAKDSLATALKLYKDMDFTGARAYLASYMDKHPEDKVAKMYLGLSLFEMSDYAKAAAHLSPLVNQKDFEYNSTAKWYLALAYMQFKSKVGYIDGSKLLQEMANDPESTYNKDAKMYLAMAK
jgi:TolA-binding protein